MIQFARLLVACLGTFLEIVQDNEFTRTGTNAFLALETIISNKQDVRTGLESCFMLLLYLLVRGSSPWAVANLNANKAKRRGVIASQDGWVEIVEDSG